MLPAGAVVIVSLPHKWILRGAQSVTVFSRLNEFIPIFCSYFMDVCDHFVPLVYLPKLITYTEERLIYTDMCLFVVIIPYLFAQAVSCWTGSKHRAFFRSLSPSSTTLDCRPAIS